MAEVPQCWSCGKDISGNVTECPHCGMPLKKETSEGDLDFLDDLLAATSSSDSSANKSEGDELDFVIPDMDYVSGRTDETSSPKGEFDEGYGETEDSLDFVIPDMDYVSGTTDESSSPKGEFDEGYGEEEDDLDFVIPDMDYVSGVTDVTSSPKGEFDTVSQQGQIAEKDTSGSNISKSDKESLLADMDSLFDEQEVTDQTEEFNLDFADDIDQLLDKPVEKVVEVTEEEVGPKAGMKKLVWLFSSQIFYWTTIYILIVFASFEVVNPNFDPAAIIASDFNITPFGFLIAWASFLVMGWFYSFKLQEYKIPPDLKYGILFLVLYTISIYVTTYVMLFAYIGSTNPQINPINYLLSSYFLILPQHYLSTLISAGWFFFILGYKYLWEHIYKLTPAYDMVHGSFEL